MKARSTLAVCLFLLWTSFVWAQANDNGISSTPASSSYSVSNLSGGIHLRCVAGAAFTADVVKESTQLLPDGTSTHTETHGKMFRDSLGRTRSESEVASSAGASLRHFVTIIDPVEQLSIVLDEEAKKASIFRLPAPSVSVGAMNRQANAQKVHSSGGHTATEQAAENLGVRMMEGFSVTGKRRAHPAEASAARDSSRNVVTESWFSPELKVELLATTRVSQSLTRSTRLTNIAPGEPDPALFQVPSGYVIQRSATQESSGQK